MQKMTICVVHSGPAVLEKLKKGLQPGLLCLIQPTLAASMTPTGPPVEPSVISSYLKRTCLPLPALCGSLGGCLTPARACPELG